MKLLRTVMRTLSGRMHTGIPEAGPVLVRPWACQDVATCIADLGPLMTELLAAAQHTRQLAWLGARASHADAYRLVARRLILDIDAGYRAITHGTGTLEDLVAGLVPPAERMNGDVPPRGHAI